MLLEFKFKNFKSFRDETSFTLESDSSKLFKENTFEIKNPSTNKTTNLLKSSFICGANASGKSNFYEALESFIGLINSPLHSSEKEKIDFYNPFVNDKSKPTYFEMIFLIDGIKYNYILEYNSKKIFFESLKYYPKGKSSLIYSIDHRFEISKINFKKNFKGLSKNLLDSNLKNNLFLKFAGMNNITIIKDVNDFFNTKFLFLKNYDLYAMINNLKLNLQTYLDSENNKNKIVTYLKKADFGIADLVLETPDLSDLETVFNPIKDIPQFETIKKTAMSQISNISSIFAKHDFLDAKLPFLAGDFESNGTKRFFYLLIYFLQAIEENKLLIIDELESSLHPELLILLINMFNSSKNNSSQLIFTTQEYILLDTSLSSFRKDQIWFSEKNKQGESEIYSLSDFKDVRDTTRIFRNYFLKKFGAYPEIE